MSFSCFGPFGVWSMTITAPTFFNISGSFFFFFFFFFSFDFSFVTLTFCFCFFSFFFFLSLVLSGGGFFFFSFFSFFFNLYFYYFFKKTLLEKYNVLLFVLFKKDMMVNLYKFYFQPNQKIFHPSTFPPSQPNTNEEN